MRQVVVVFVTCLLSISASISLSAQEKPSVGPTKWSGSVSSTAGNRYVGATVCAPFANQTVVQSEFDVTRTSKSTTLTVTVWNSTGLIPSTAFKTNAYETDVDINVTHRFGKYNFAVGGWMFFLNPTAKTDAPVGDLKVSRDFVRGKNSFAPFAEVQWYGTTDSKAAGFHGGVYPMIGVAYSRPIVERVVFTSQVHTNYDVSGGFGHAQGKTMLATDASLKFAFMRSFVATAHAGLVGSVNDSRRPWVPVFNVGISHSF